MQAIEKYVKKRITGKTSGNKFLSAQSADTIPVYNRFEPLLNLTQPSSLDQIKTSISQSTNNPTKSTQRSTFNRIIYNHPKQSSFKKSYSSTPESIRISSIINNQDTQNQQIGNANSANYNKPQSSTTNPNPNFLKDSDETILKVSNTNTSINHIKYTQQYGQKAIILANILGHKQEALLDTGSQINAISKKLLPSEIIDNLLPTSYSVTSYTGNTVDICGTFETDIQIGSIQLQQCLFYVINDDRNTIIGTPAIKDNNIIIHLTENYIKQGENIEKFLEVGGSTCSTNTLGLRTSKTPPIQMETNELITIPKNCEKFITVQPRHGIDKYGHYAITDAFDHNIAPGILIGKSVSILSPEDQNCIIRVCNINDHDIIIAPHTRILNLHSVEIKETVIGKRSNQADCAKFRKVMKDIKIGSTNDSSIQQLRQVIKDNLDAFAIDDEPLGCTDKAVYDIDTGNSSPTQSRRYRTPYYLRDEMKRIIQKNVNDGLMEPCSSPYAAPVLLVKKPSGAWRLVCDYRKLNSVTISDCYPLPLIEDLVTSLSKSRVFSCSDLWTGFHQIPCSERAKEKLAITTEFGQFTWLNMPMGGKNAPSVFQRLMDRIFQSIPRSELVIYLDDMLCHSATEEENINQLRQVFQILAANKLKLRASKSQFLMNEIQFCGYVIGNGKKKPNPQKVVDVKNMKPPTSKSEAQSVYGCLNYHRFFIPRFAAKAAPISKSYRGQFKWTTEAQNALDSLKIEICSKALELRIPDVNTCKFVLETDASNKGYGACLFMCTNNNNHHSHNSKCLRPIEYASKQFTPAQQKYTTMEKELFAGRESLRKWRHFLLGRKFTWFTDNTCLQWAYRTQSHKAKISQWLTEITEFDINLERRPSTSMKISDCLSRSFPTIAALQLSKRDLADLQDNDATLNQVRNYVTNDRWPNNPSPEISSYLRLREFLVFGNSGELLLNKNGRVRSIPPKSLRKDILEAFHDKIAHPGEKQTIGQLENNYFWPSMSTDAKDYIRVCHECQTTKPNLHPKQPPLGESETASRPWEILSWDLIGPLPITDDCNRFILTGFDLFSKRVYGIALHTKESIIVMNAIRRVILQHPRLPRVILTDNGTEFTRLDQFCQQHGIKHNLSAPYHPAANGGVERANQTLKNRLFSIGESNKWDDRLDETLHSMNCSIHAVTKLSPFSIETGYEGQNHQDVIVHEAPIRENVQQYDEVVKSRIQAEKDIRLNKFRKDNFQPFDEGDLVLIKNMVGKFPRFEGPYRIITVRGNGLSYELKHQTTQRTTIRYVTQLKRYRTSQVLNEQDDNQYQQEDAQVERTNTDNTAERDSASQFLIEAPSMQPNPTESASSNSDPPASNNRKSSRKRKLPFSSNRWDGFYMEVTKPQTSEPPKLDQTQFFDSREELDNEEISIDPETSKQVMPCSSQRSDDDSLSEIKLSECDKNELARISKTFGIEISGNVEKSKKQIDKFFKSHFPQHKRRAGCLVFHRKFEIDEELSLHDLSKTLLKALIHDYKLPKPIFYSISTKEDLREHINYHLKSLHPNHPVNSQGTLIFKPANTTTSRDDVANNTF